MSNLIGITIDYSDICKNYNTAYLDRDNTDPATTKCMKSVLAWVEGFVNDLLNDFNFNIYQLSSNTPLLTNEIASKRFLFYSLEKEITLQGFMMSSSHVKYSNYIEYIENSPASLLIQNDEEGEGLHLYMEEDSNLHKNIKSKLSDFTLDEAPKPRP